MMTNLSYQKYEKLIKGLSVKITKGIKAPHKAIMLITIIDCISKGNIHTNRIELADELASEFRNKWNYYIAGNKNFSIYSCAPWTPFWHLKKEPFWHFYLRSNCSNVDNIVAPGETASIGKMRTNIEYAYLDNELFSLLSNATTRNQIKQTLVNEYIESYKDVKSNSFVVEENCNNIYGELDCTKRVILAIDAMHFKSFIEAIKKLPGFIDYQEYY